MFTLCSLYSLRQFFLFRCAKLILVFLVRICYNYIVLPFSSRTVFFPDNGDLMFTNNYTFAGHVVEINSIFSEVHQYCAEYRSQKPPVFSVTTDQNDISYERERSYKEDIAEGRPHIEYSDSYLEELAVYRKIAEKAPDWDTLLFHGSVIAVDGQGFLFTAKSGTGKSTHTRLWREVFGERAVMVNDDKPLLTVADGSVIAHGTPYNGKHSLGCNISVPLKGLCILTRGADNSIVSISKQDAYPMLIQQVYRPSDPVQMHKTLLLVDKLAEFTSLYKLKCNMEKDAAITAFNGMKG